MFDSRFALADKLFESKMAWRRTDRGWGERLHPDRSFNNIPIDAAHADRRRD
jgi:hypothetical protein